MYDQRVKVFIAVSLGLLLMCVLRLAQMQLVAGSATQDEIARLKDRWARSQQLRTLRGRILDRQGRVIAADTPRFRVYVNYRLSSYLDERVVLAKMLEAQQENDDISLDEVRHEVQERRRQIERVIEECAQFGAGREQIEAAIQARNNRIWRTRSQVRWARSNYDPNLVSTYGSRVSVPFQEAMADLERQYSDPNERYRRIAQVNDIPEVNMDLALVVLEREDDVFAAQLAFGEMDDVQVLPSGHRYYPYGIVAAQTLGWVGPATQPRDIEIFEDDPYASYLDDDVCGREGGVEFVCETILRGRRGELVYDIDLQLVREIDTEFGRDVQVTLDIELQRRIEERLTDPQINPRHHRSPMAAVVIEIATGDILALVSLPTHDLNRTRWEWGKLNEDPNRPLINRTLALHYAPGSVIKPLILIAGLEAGLITPEEAISCPAAPQPRGWPNCWIFRQHRVGHDGTWTNNARNAIKGSCNIYFTHLAHRIEPRMLQEWLFKFGYGRQVPLPSPLLPPPGAIHRSLRQTPGEIGSLLVQTYTEIDSLEQIPPLREWERRLFGIGHGNFRATPLQVANNFATLARRGRLKMPRLFLDPASPPAETVDLQIAPAHLQVVHDGLRAAVNERGGTGYEAFRGNDLAARGVRIYGKTGSTEDPPNAWFACYAEDRNGPRVAVAVLVEGGSQGSSDAAPLAREILQLCAAAGYLAN